MNLKQKSAEKALDFISDGMTVGIGTGTTVFYFIQALAKKVENGLNVKCVSTSSATTSLAQSLGLTITELKDVDKIDVTVDGADEVNAAFIGIKGGGGALLHEKLVATASVKNVWIIDESKYVEKLGGFPLPLEVIPASRNLLLRVLELKGYKPTLRRNKDGIFYTDETNNIIDLHLKDILSIETHVTIEELHKELKLMAGVVETGIFLNIVDIVIIGRSDSVDVLKRVGD